MVSPTANIAPLESKVVERWNKRIRFTSFKDKMIKKGVYETALVAVGMLQNDPSSRITLTAANALLALSEPLKLRNVRDIKSGDGSQSSYNICLNHESQSMINRIRRIALPSENVTDKLFLNKESVLHQEIAFLAIKDYLQKLEMLILGCSGG